MHHDHQLTIGSMLHTGLTAAPQQRIIHGDHVDMSYVEFGQRVRRLGSALNKFFPRQVHS